MSEKVEVVKLSELMQLVAATYSAIETALEEKKFTEDQAEAAICTLRAIYEKIPEMHFFEMEVES